MELVKRYIAAVQRELPEQKREEIGRELNANIMDQLDSMSAQQGELTASAVSVVLKQLGHPRTVAQQFVPPLPLISSAYMSLYINTLFMVLGVLFVLQVITSSMAWLGSANMGLVGYLFNLARGFMEDAYFAFTAITLSYWLISRKQPEPKSCNTKNWLPEQLPAAGQTWQHIKLQDIFTDLATYIFLLVVIWYPQFMPTEQLASINLLLSDQLMLILQWSTPVIMFGIGSSLWQLRSRLWNKTRLIMNVVVNSFFAALAVFIATITPLLQESAFSLQKVFTLLQIERTAMIVFVVIAIITIWEVVRDIWRLRKLSYTH
ncbi:hypothetical protein [Aliidiomarina quisquiliarum]|uniref:hypothetical protein n=1 Tax=Aliidiomarina quisquiliarum TaxID=2938947 RepID=UPI00208E3848|nr:hypothetical protein [Aliidiomarina quisquiliarum]MCO4320037.1 hypothetical protein [Aliidiomarina quisquiliarum]